MKIETRETVLRAIADILKESGRLETTGETVAAFFAAFLEQEDGELVIDYLTIMITEGLVSGQSSKGNWIFVRLTSRGRLWLKDPAFLLAGDLDWKLERERRVSKPTTH